MQSGQAVATQRALEYLPDQESIEWIEPGADVPSRVTVLDTVETPDGYCRRLTFQPGQNSDGVTESYCRDPESGSWQFAGTADDL